MKSSFLLLLLTSGHFLLAQSFTEIPISAFENVELGRSAFADVDGDNDKDVLITGWSGTEAISKLYINDGNGIFSEMPGTPFIGILRGSVAFADIDGDDDQDVLLSGRNGILRFSKLYTNDGKGVFSEVTDTPFDGIENGYSNFADVDNDNDMDVLITGQTGNRNISKLYLNDGNGNYIEKTGTPFTGVSFGYFDFADVDGDNDKDVLITGQLGSEGISKLYINDGLGSFSEQTGSSFHPVMFSFVAFSDVDGDKDEDVLITGLKRTNSSVAPISKMYINDGLGNFTEITENPFKDLDTGSSDFADVDGDNDLDVLISGGDSLENPFTKLYINDGNGIYTEMIDHPFVNVTKSSVVFEDIDGDNDNDVLITGENSSGNPTTKLYLNNGVVSSTEEQIIRNRLEFNLFPNPSSFNTLYLNYISAKVEKISIKVYNTAGVLLHQQIETTNYGQQTFSVDITSFVPGNYFIKIDNGKKTGVVKFVTQ